MRRPIATLSLLGAALCALTVGVLSEEAVELPVALGPGTESLVLKALSATALVLAIYGVYRAAVGGVEALSTSRQRTHDARNVLQLGFLAAATIGVLGVLTDQRVGVLVSLGIVGFGITFALQQPLFSLLGWAYILLKRPYQVGDRVRIGDARGDVIAVDFLVTTLWEVGGDLVSGHQPSGRMVTLPNSLVLSSEVYNYSLPEFPYVWNELTIQVAYETDLSFAREAMYEEADDYLGDEMARRVGEYRKALAETPVDLEVRERPSVNVTQTESWVELRLRYLAHPRRMQATRNELYERILDRFCEHPDRVMFPVGRNR